MIVDPNIFSNAGTKCGLLCIVCTCDPKDDGLKFCRACNKFTPYEVEGKPGGYMPIKVTCSICGITH